MRVDVVIPNYNSSKLLEKNLPKTLAVLSNYKSINNIIVVDDGSKKDEIIRIREIIKKLSLEFKLSIKLIEQDRNRGFSSTVNHGVSKSGADLVFLLNTDAVPEEGFLEPVILDFKNDDTLFGVGCMDKSIEGGKIILRGRGEGGWSRGFLVHNKGKVDKKDTLWISGGSSFIKREIFSKLGGFDELFNPFYWEDIELSYRAQKCGYKILFENKSRVVHYHEEGSIKSHYNPFFVKTIAYRNQFIFVWKDITDKELLFNHFIFLPYHFFSTLINFDLAFILGFFLAAFKLPAIIQKRQVAQKSFRLKDKDIIHT